MTAGGMARRAAWVAKHLPPQLRCHSNDGHWHIGYRAALSLGRIEDGAVLTKRQAKEEILNYYELHHPVAIPTSQGGTHAIGGASTARKESADFYNSKAWRKLRYKVLSKFGGRCLCCGASAKDGKVMHVDHIKPRSLYPRLALEEDNLQVLCEDCNIIKGNRDQIDWREVRP